MREVYDHIEANIEPALDNLIEYCRLPTVSALGQSIEETARYTRDLLEREGFSARIIEKQAGGYPVVFGEHAGTSPRTLMLYNHYDVQPADPLNEWTAQPFEPERRGHRLYGRGASDNKGNIISRLLAVRAIKQRFGGLPCSIKFVIEGDEEIGSPQIAPFLRQHRDLVRSDACIWEGGYAFWDGSPTLMLGVKGLLCVELEIGGPSRDVHSSYGTVIPNPAWQLAWALGSLKGPDERILIDGFYDDVRSPSEEELATLHILPDESTQVLSDLGLDRAVLGVQGADYNKRHIMEPTCTINGLTSGYQGPSVKTVLPSRAIAKLDFRLVVAQDPEDIMTKLRAHFARYGFDDIKITQYSTEHPARTEIADPFVDLAQDAAREVYGRSAYLVPNMPQTGPMYHFLHELDVPCVLAGINYIGSRDHAPDEHIRVEDFRLGTKHIAAIINRFGQG
jgi:acetylornithine deacetylase/succinyl-diaminopimelate desuccinylase-like protein